MESPERDSGKTRLTLKGLNTFSYQIQTLTIHFNEWQIILQLTSEFIQDIFRLKSVIRIESLFSIE